MKDLGAILAHTTEVCGCMEWSRCLNSDGYPRAVIDGYNNAKVHRVVFELVHGYLPEVVRHTCDNPKCINPAHLIGGTNVDNVRDRVSRGRCYNKVTDQEIDDLLQAMQYCKSRAEAARKLGISLKRAEYIMNKVKQA